ncbi:LEAF RUST 10 DISEASE-RESISTANCEUS RECEPTOR-LIKE PROTEIN KINASE-like 2.5 [Miscanthus floridulus]|uniref:LEAF RUST 10 DISEASE-RESISTANCEUS RECEPTOR-LIKE PROTEIN KINASE-like 2.5 n=1 Tax=Miscanthus floridulus TaxID=154761 RepID=UPI0034595D08
MHCLSLALPPLLITLLLTSLTQCQPQPDDDAYFRYSNCAPTPYRCGSVQFDVGYPLSVTGSDDQPDYCSFPGYRLSCTSTNGSSKLLITMNAPAGAWTFQVTGVDYENRLLTLVDQGLAQQTCLQPYRNTTIDGARFAYTDRDQFLTVYVNCSGGGSAPLVVDVLSCLSEGRSYYSLDNGTVAPDVLGTCSSTLVVPYNSSMDAAGSSGLTLGNAIKGGFAARWTAGAGWCRDCENSGGRCGYNSSSPSDHTCYCSDGTFLGTCSSGIFCPQKSSFASQGFLFLPSSTIIASRLLCSWLV